MSELGDFQFGILPRIFSKLCLVISTFSCYVTLTSLCKYFNHFTSLLWFTDSLHMSPQNFFDSSASGWSSSYLSSSWFNSLKNCRWLFGKISFCLKLPKLSWYVPTFAAIATVLCFNSSITTPNVLLYYCIFFLMFANALHC